MGQASQPPLTIWAVSDGRAGIEAQALGLAQAVARLRPAQIVVKRIGWRWGLGRLPEALNPALAVTLVADTPIAPPWPDIWIAAGRATLPLSRRMRVRSGGRTFVVQTQDPRGGLSAFDLVVPPEHDGLSGPNVFPILGAPTRLTRHRLAEEAAVWRQRLGDLPHPRVTAVIGGRSRAYDLPPDHARRLAEQIHSAVASAGGSLLLSFTRRTPPAARQVMTEILDGLPGLIWNDEGENPYVGMLGLADVILVTEDSTNLATDAAATGKPVQVLTMSGTGSPKFRRFHLTLAGRGVTRPFEGRLEAWSYPPLAETDRAAAELVRRFDARK